MRALNYYETEWSCGNEKGTDLIFALDEEHAEEILRVRRGVAVVVEYCAPASKSEVAGFMRQLKDSIDDYAISARIGRS